ncbi:MAG: ring-hydroxylating dioxygenase, large terminal subunit [Acidimicrobiales bacterium]|jgi:choline monooxygenase|nr:ring-hydroxylating dioxygenase, large terminal subunit [Acidimicrobiales bacterium]
MPVLPKARPLDRELARRALELVEAGTTEMAESVLRVPLDYYNDPARFAREQSLLATTPLALAPSCRLPSPHDYLVRDVLGTSVVMSRDGDGKVRAFLNYCRHRGARPADGCGNTRRFTCPYHAWTYDSAGRLVGMPGAEGFAEVDRGDYGLVQLPCEERHGMVWVVLTAGAPIDISAHLGPLDDELAQWDFGSYEYLTEREFESDVNWKAALEAFAESYHFPYVHGNSLIGQNTIANTAVFDPFGKHYRLGFACPWIVNARGKPDPGPPLDSMALIYWIFPNLVLAVSAVGAELIDLLPAGSPTRCTVRHGWMAREPSTDDATRAGYQALYEAVHAAVRDEDFAMLPTCGDAIRHAQHDHMLIGRNEIAVQHVVRTFADALGFALP